MARRTITFIQQNDTHAQLELHGECFWRDGQPEYRRAGGFARIATLARQIREQFPNVLLVECGDEIHGTGPAQWTEGAVIPPVLNALRPAVLTPGNWEWGFGPETLRERVSEMAFPVVACNVKHADTGRSEFPATFIDDSTGVRIGFLGVTSPIVSEKMPHKFGAGLRFSDPLSAIPAYVEALRHKDKVDLVVLVSHVGLAQDIELVERVGGIDVVLSGHTHDRLTRPVVVGRTVLIQSGFGGSFLGRLTLEVDAGQVQSWDHELLEVSEALNPDPTASAIVDEQLKPFRERLSEPVGRTAAPLHRLTALDSPMDNVLTDAYRELTGADVAFSHGWRYGSLIADGTVTVGDLWQIVPTNPELFVGELTGREIRKLIEASLESTYSRDPLRQKGGYPIRTSGLSALVRINNPQNSRVLQLDIAGEPYREDKVYRVVGAGEQDLQQVESRQPCGIHAVDAMREYFHGHEPVDPTRFGSRLVVM